MRRNEVRVADGEERIGRGADIGPHEPGHRSLADQRGQLQAAERFIETRGDEAGSGKGIERGFDFRDQGHAFTVERRFVQIGLAVVRGEQVGSDFFTGGQNCIEGFARMFGVARAGG